MAVVGLLTVSDGRESVHRDVMGAAAAVEQRIAVAIEQAGHTLARAQDLIWTNELAVTEARRIAEARPALTIVNIPIWAFPHFTMRAARELSTPVLLFSNLDPRHPGMVGMLAAAGALDQIGRSYGRVWGEVEDPAVWAQIAAQIQAGSAVEGLRGSSFGRIGGRSMGMYTAVANSDRWLKQFGVDVEEIDQWEIVRRADEIDQPSVTAAREWLERHAAEVHYDGKRLTPELLERQIRSYYVMRLLIDEWNLDFCGIKGQPELTNDFATMDIAEAFLNDPYDWDGPKEPIVCATEADMDGALTMQILKTLSEGPVLFADVRHYHPDLDIWDLCNSGQHATWFASRSDDPAENMRRVNLYPADFYFPAGGASVHHLAAAGEFTFARLTRLDQRYRMQVLRGQLRTFEEAINERLMHASTYVWPHAFARLETTVEEFLGRYGSNHIHAVPGDYVQPLREICRLLDVDFDGFGGL
jgi:L-fucose/D-arabinose isomerase